MVGMLLVLWFILAQAPGQRLVGIYEGTLPCTGCSGIRTTLALYTGSLAEPRDGTFTLKETYVESLGGDKVLESLGQWIAVRGTATDPDATTYQLTASAATQSTYFLRVDSDTLRMLDGERREIASQGNYTLTLTTTLPSLDGR
jgi:uncharacterized lipoprotein NlpE involved in copper resistance